MAKNPADMTDKELEDAIANPPAEGLIPPVEVVVPPEKKPDKKEPLKEEEPAPELPKPSEEIEEEEPTPAKEEEPSRREKLRIIDVLAKLKEKEATPAKAPVDPDALDYTKDLEADPALIKKLQDDRQAAADAAYQRGIAQANSMKFHTRLEIDAPRVEAKYPQLDKTDEKNFNSGLANAVNTMYLSAVGYNPETDTVTNPDMRYAEYIEGIFELANEIGTQNNEATRKNIVKQVANTGLRPDGSRTKTLNLNKLPEQMTDEELDARIALAIPPALR